MKEYQVSILEGVTVAFCDGTDMDDLNQTVSFFSAIEVTNNNGACFHYQDEPSSEDIVFWYQLAKAHNWIIDGEQWLIDEYVKEWEQNKK